MKILFAVNNDNVSEAIAKKYEKQYKDIISYKNVYYFNAIIRELQKDKTYNRVVISEDLEPFANNNYNMIDKFLLEKYSNISKEARTLNEEKIEIILLCADRRRKAEDMLIKIYNLEIYNAIIGSDRSIDEVCKLIYDPRDKGLARQYYDIPVNDLAGQDDENNVSEAEVENILAHYKRLGKNEDKYVDSFNNIISQYTDTQLKIIIRYLPIHVKAVLEEKSPKYQQLVTSGLQGQNANFDTKTSKYKEKLQKQKKGFSWKKETNNTVEQDNENDEPLIDREFTKPKLTQPIVIPSDINTANVQKINVKSMAPNITQQQDSNHNEAPSPFVEDKPIEPEPIPAQMPEPIIQNVNQEQNEVQETSSSETDLFDDFLNTPEGETTDDPIIPIVENSIQKIEVPEIKPAPIQQFGKSEVVEGIPNMQEEPQTIENIQPEQETVAQEPVKRGRGRPRTKPIVEIDPNQPKRGRGRPKKQEPFVAMQQSNQNIGQIDNVIEQQETVQQVQKAQQIQQVQPIHSAQIVQPIETVEPEENDLFSMSEETIQQQTDTAPNLSDMFENEPVQSGISQLLDDDEEEEDSIDLFSISEDEEEINNQQASFSDNNIIQPQNTYEPEPANLFNMSKEQQHMEVPIKNNDEIITTNKTSSYSNLNALLTSDKKIVAFVGTTKNGTSFVVNNTAETLASMGISTAILDMTKTKNAYYIYTNNEEELREIATRCMRNLENGIAEGIKPTRNLTIYTEMPGEEENYNLDKVLTTLVQNYDAVLIDTDFDTPTEIFDRVQEIYLVQSMDVLTIQPLTAFLRNLKSKNILKQEKLKIVINKSEKVRSLNIKTLIGGMSCYNAPNMSYMTELFDKDNIRYCEIPFEVQNYVKYLDSLVNCSITLNGYTKTLLTALRELANMVYPLVGKQTYSPMSGNKKDPFSKKTSSTLNKMKSKGY